MIYLVHRMNDHVGESKCQLKNIRLLLKILEW